jgi:hypothetical protein
MLRTVANATKSARLAVIKWVLLEERHNHRGQFLPALHGEAQERMTMIVVTPTLDDLPASEDSLKEFRCGPRGCGLGDRELVLDLPAEEAPAVSHHRDREAALAVNEPDDPLLDAWPFLLIARTGRIVTVHRQTLQ